MSFWEKPQICNKENNGIIQDIKFPLSYQLSLSKKCEEKASQPPCKVYSTTPTSDVAKEDNRREVPSWEYTQGLQDTTDSWDSSPSQSPHSEFSKCLETKCLLPIFHSSYIWIQVFAVFIRSLVYHCPLSIEWTETLSLQFMSLRTKKARSRCNDWIGLLGCLPHWHLWLTTSLVMSVKNMHPKHLT